MGVDISEKKTTCACVHHNLIEQEEVIMKKIAIIAAAILGVLVLAGLNKKNTKTTTKEAAATSSASESTTAEARTERAQVAGQKAKPQKMDLKPEEARATMIAFCKDRSKVVEKHAGSCDELAVGLKNHNRRFSTFLETYGYLQAQDEKVASACLSAQDAVKPIMSACIPGTSGVTMASVEYSRFIKTSTARLATAATPGASNSCEALTARLTTLCGSADAAKRNTPGVERLCETKLADLDALQKGTLNEPAVRDKNLKLGYCRR